MKFILFLIVLLWPLCIYADDAVCIYTKDGQINYFLIQDNPKVIITINGVEISTKKETVIYPLDKFSMFTFENMASTSLDSKKASVYIIKENFIKVNGEAKVYDIQGRQLVNSPTGMIDISKIPKGLFIVKTGKVSFKYLKR